MEPGDGWWLPRSVPQDAVVSLIAGPLPGQLLQKSILLLTFILAGVGAGRLAGRTLTLQLPAAAPDICGRRTPRAAC